MKKTLKRRDATEDLSSVDLAAWTHNTNVMVSGYTPLQLMTGKSVMYPGIAQGNEATESMYENEGVRRIMEGHFEVGKKFRELEFGSKIEKAANSRMQGFEDMVIEKDDRVFYQTQNEKAWLGPAKALNVDKNWVWISGNGDYKKVPKCNVKLSTKKDTVDFEDVEDEKEETEERIRMRSMTK